MKNVFDINNSYGIIEGSEIFYNGIISSWNNNKITIKKIDKERNLVINKFDIPEGLIINEIQNESRQLYINTIHDMDFRNNKICGWDVFIDSDWNNTKIIKININNINIECRQLLISKEFSTSFTFNNSTIITKTLCMYELGEYNNCKVVCENLAIDGERNSKLQKLKQYFGHHKEIDRLSMGMLIRQFLGFSGFELPKYFEVFFQDTNKNISFDLR